jgi:signal transduction histidine kinase
LALDFFRDTSPYGDHFTEYKDQLNRERDLLKKRERSTRARRKEFTDRLNRFFGDLEHGRPATEAASIRDLVKKRLEAIVDIREPDGVASALIELEEEARQRIQALNEANTVTRPRSVGLSKSLKADWNAYMRNVEKVRREVLEPLTQDIDGMITGAAASRKTSLDRRRRIVLALGLKRKTVTSETIRLRREVEQALNDLAREAEEALQFSLNRVTTDLERISADIERTDLTRIPDAESRALQQMWENRIDTTARETRDLLEPLRDQLASVAKAVRERESLEETTAAIESAAEQYRDELESYVELAQIGMALGIVQHEFGVAARNIRNAIRKLKPWADGTPDLKGLYRDLRVEFDHLDGYLKLFTPLSRRLHRQAVELSGEEIRRYLVDVFYSRLERHSIRLTAAPAFDRMSARCYPSTYLPAFVNIVDNAIYWITTDKDSERLIKLDSDGKSFTVWNGGPGIERRIADRIFDFGETTKPGGRGIGLYLAREGLRREGAELALDADGFDVHPVFRITPSKDGPASEEER